MEAVAVRISFKSGYAVEDHSQRVGIWPELAETKKTAGILDYLVQHDQETGAPFATLWCDDSYRMATLSKILPEVSLVQRNATVDEDISRRLADQLCAARPFSLAVSDHADGDPQCNPTL